MLARDAHSRVFAVERIKIAQVCRQHAVDLRHVLAAVKELDQLKKRRLPPLPQALIVTWRAMRRPEGCGESIMNPVKRT